MVSVLGLAGRSPTGKGNQTSDHRPPYPCLCYRYRVNCYDYVVPTTPFGGYKQSGSGRELGYSGIELYLETKSVTIKLPAKV